MRNARPNEDRASFCSRKRVARLLQVGQAAGATSLIDRDASSGTTQLGVCCVIAVADAPPALNTPVDGTTFALQGCATVEQVTLAVPVP
jgi:hypothetical protein